MGSVLVADLGFDSLRMLELVAELEDEFGIFIPLDDVPAITTVQQAVDRVVTLLGSRVGRDGVGVDAAAGD